MVRASRPTNRYHGSVWMGCFGHTAGAAAGLATATWGLDMAPGLPTRHAGRREHQRRLVQSRMSAAAESGAPPVHSEGAGWAGQTLPPALTGRYTLPVDT